MYAWVCVMAGRQTDSCRQVSVDSHKEISVGTRVGHVKKDAHCESVISMPSAVSAAHIMHDIVTAAAINSTLHALGDTRDTIT